MLGQEEGGGDVCAWWDFWWNFRVTSHEDKAGRMPWKLTGDKPSTVVLAWHYGHLLGPSASRFGGLSALQTLF